MQVKQLMSAQPETCRSTTPLAQAARIMSEHNCGCLPVIDEATHVVGMITDRDISLAIAERHSSPWRIAVKDAMTHGVLSCAPDDSVDRALAAFRRLGVRRLPVVDAHGHLKGVLSIDDLVRHIGDDGVSAEAVLRTLKSVFAAETGRTVVAEY